LDTIQVQDEFILSFVASFIDKYNTHVSTLSSIVIHCTELNIPQIT